MSLSILSTAAQSLSFNEEQPFSVTKQRSPFHLHVITDETALSQKDAIKALRKTLRDWQDIIHDRLGTTRSKRQEAYQQGVSTQEQDSHFDSDKATVADYLCVKKMIDRDISDLMSGIDKKRHIFVLSDLSANVQAAASIHEEVDALYVNTIMTAPWNVQMHAGVADEHSKITVKRSGTTLMRQIYEFARLKQKSTIELKPLSNSFSYYQGFLKMSLAENGKVFYYSVSAEAIPDALDVAAGNLLHF